jgi:hypothetical protein
MKEWRIEMRDMQKVAMPGGAGNQDLLAKSVDRFVNNGHSAANPANACVILSSYDGLDCETIVVMGKLLEKISGVSANSSNQPTCVDCDYFGHALVTRLQQFFGESLSVAS